MIQVEMFHSDNGASVGSACESLQERMNVWLRNRSPIISVRTVVMDTPKQMLLPVSTSIAVKKQAKAYWFIVGMITYDDGAGDV